VTLSFVVRATGIKITEKVKLTPPTKTVHCNMRYVLFLFTLLFVLGCTTPKSPYPHVILYTELGDIELELYPDKAPKTVAAFLSYIDAGHYTKAAFYRVLLTEGMSPEANIGLIQGGRWDGKNDSLPGIPHESTRQTGLSHTDGTLSLARTTVGSANTEFFICIGNQTQFDYGNTHNGDTEGFSAFGRVVKGMRVVRKLQLSPASGESFAPPIPIRQVTITGR
jgi:peptidyl-prolyl cis-trans isomerase A (cyclophilin A)